MFVTFEGPEGSGKSTQCRRLARWLEQAGRSVVLTYEPGGTPLGDAIRRILLEPNQQTSVNRRTEVLLFAAARAQLVDDVIRPSLNDGAIVISDRYSDSTIAYQCGGRGLAIDDVTSVLQFAITGLTPDLTFLLDLDVSLGLARKRGAGPDRLEGENLAFHERVREAYLRLAAESPARIVVLDARRPPDDLAAEILHQFESFEADPRGS